MTDRTWKAIAAGTLVAAVAIRWGRLALAWDYWAIDYVAYAFPFRDDLANGAWSWTRLMGQHPGQWALAASGILAAGGSIATLYAFSVALSVGAIGAGVAWIGRTAGWPAAALFGGLAALSPHLAHYGGELNNYPVFLGGAAVATVAVAAAWGCEGPDRNRWLLATAAGAAIAMHGHLAAVATIGGLGLWALAGRQWRAAAALAAGAATATPILLQLVAHHEVDANVHNASLSIGAWLPELRGAWVGRFGTTASFASLAAATVAAAGVVARTGDGPVRRSTVAAAVAGGAGITSIAYAQLTGAAFVAQTPYWVHVAWCQLAIVALGIGVAGPRARAAIGLLLVPWLLFALPRAIAPAGGAAVTTGVPADGPALAAYVEAEVRPGDVLVYAWDVAWLNDTSRAVDHRMAGLRPGDVGDFLDREAPFPGYCHEVRDFSACWLNSAGTRDDEQGRALVAAVDGWLEAGATVHLVRAHSAPDRPGDLRRLADAADVASEDHAGTTPILRLGATRP